MDMWNWLMEAYEDNYIKIENLEKIMTDDKAAYDLYQEFVNDDIQGSIEWTRSEIGPIINYLKIKK